MTTGCGVFNGVNVIETMPEKSLFARSQARPDAGLAEMSCQAFDQMKNSFSIAKLENAPRAKLKPATKAKEIFEPAPNPQLVVPEINMEELEAELNDSGEGHNAPPAFLSRPAPSTPRANFFTPKSNAFPAPKLPLECLTPQSRTHVLLASTPVFKQNKLPPREGPEVFVGLDIELIDDSVGPKREGKCDSGKASRTTAGNSSGCSADVFADMVSSVEKRESVGPHSFVAHKLLGKGSFGEVYLVEKLGSQAFFAMKVLNKEQIMSQNLVKYALTERKVLSAVNHPFIVRLHYAFQSSSKLFLVLDYCPGGDLNEHLRREKRYYLGERQG